MASRKQTLEQALKTLRDPDGTGRTRVSSGFSGEPMKQVGGPPDETAAPEYRNGYAAGLAFARGSKMQLVASVERFIKAAEASVYEAHYIDPDYRPAREWLQTVIKES